MSLFLGKIHYWLFNKILWFENLETEIIDYFKDFDKLNAQKILELANSKYGQKLENKNLEEIIDQDNIHGWLQQRINSSEGRLAFIISNILNSDESYINDLEKIYKNQAKKVSLEVKKENLNAKDLYTVINDYLLDGMPCDRVNDVYVIEDDLVKWKKTKCVHKEIWQNENIDVKVFYDLRDIWIDELIKNLNDKYEYTKENDEFSIKLK